MRKTTSYQELTLKNSKNPFSSADVFMLKDFLLY